MRYALHNQSLLEGKGVRSSGIQALGTLQLGQ
jgi:hypothetical protein